MARDQSEPRGGSRGTEGEMKQDDGLGRVGEQESTQSCSNRSELSNLRLELSSVTY